MHDQLIPLSQNVSGDTKIVIICVLQAEMMMIFMAVILKSKIAAYTLAIFMGTKPDINVHTISYMCAIVRAFV